MGNGEKDGNRIETFSASYLDSLVIEAAASPRLRQHRNIHRDYADPCQRFFNAIEPDSYIRPHRHSQPSRAETMFAVRGRMAMLLFDDEGQIVDKATFGQGTERADVFGVEIPAGCWHTVVALESGSVLLEVKAGPFDAAHPKEFAPWAPEEKSEHVRQYVDALLSMARL